MFRLRIRYICFFRTVCLSVFICLALAAWLLYALFGHGETEMEQQKLLKAIEITEVESGSSTLERTGLRKDVYYLKDGQRLHLQLISKEGSVIFIDSDGRHEWIEHLSDISGLIQEALGSDSQGNLWQDVRWIQAKSADALLSQNRFKAYDVFLGGARLPGHSLPETVNLDQLEWTGEAAAIDVDLSGEEPSMTATQFKGKGKRP